MKSLSESIDWADALVVDGNTLSRSVAVSQLRELGYRSVVGVSRLADARKLLELRRFDLVLCEQHFPHDLATGRAFLDDLRKGSLLPLSTIFIMLTAESGYTAVVESAESALDAYLLRPYSTAQLQERIMLARRRKLSLMPVLDAIDRGDHEGAATLCVQRVAARGEHWLHAARLGAELLLRLHRYADAHALYNEVMALQAVPWAKLGIARAQMEQHQIKQATATLAALVDTEPDYADAYDVMGRACIDLAQFEGALDAYRRAVGVTPASVHRLQRHGLLAYLCGHDDEAEESLKRAATAGLDSRMFDTQTLVVLGFLMLRKRDQRGLNRCVKDLARCAERSGSNPRLMRMSLVLDALVDLMDQQVGGALQRCRRLIGCFDGPEADAEAAVNVLMLLALLAQRAIQIEEIDDFVDRLGMRFSVSKALVELLTRAATDHPPFVARIRAAQAYIQGRIEKSVRESMQGQVRDALLRLTRVAENTGNTKVLDVAWGMWKRHESSMPDGLDLERDLLALRERHRAQSTSMTLFDLSCNMGSGLPALGPVEPSVSTPLAA